MKQVISTSRGIRHVLLSCSVCQPAVKVVEIEKPKKLDYKQMYEEIQRKVNLEKAENKLQKIKNYSNNGNHQKRGRNPDSKKNHYPKIPVGISPDVSHTDYERWIREIKRLKRRGVAV